ncbi:ATP-binding protein [Sphingomonas panni]|uniref:ATP-binding protein n=1 Tax=Sphingomonas panni TaxID=237612 RepID=UPI001F5B68D6|nr:ATP-binding protein [Sphingomonas panni]
MAKVIYLTGAPASGKSSTTRMLKERVSDLEIWEYGARLTEHCLARCAAIAGQDDLRAQSSAVVTPQDVADVDLALLAFVDERRGSRPVLIDSHAVTKESYGYRVTPFSLKQFGRLRPDEIWVFYAEPAETRRRIVVDPGGRPQVSEEQARTHTLLQGSVACTYGMSIGCAVYMFDTTQPRDILVSMLAERLA